MNLSVLLKKKMYELMLKNPSAGLYTFTPMVTIHEDQNNPVRVSLYMCADEFLEITSLVQDVISWEMPNADLYEDTPDLFHDQMQEVEAKIKINFENYIKNDFKSDVDKKVLDIFTEIEKHVNRIYFQYYSLNESLDIHVRPTFDRKKVGLREMITSMVEKQDESWADKVIYSLSVDKMNESRMIVVHHVNISFEDINAMSDEQLKKWLVSKII